jgi:hypothetical protein
VDLYTVCYAFVPRLLFANQLFAIALTVSEVIALLQLIAIYSTPMHANSKLAEPCRQSLFQIPQEVLTRHRNLGLEHVCRKMQTQSVLWQILLIAMYSIPMQANSKVLQPCRQSLLLNTPRGLNQTSPQFGFRTYPPEKCRRNQYYGKY